MYAAVTSNRVSTRTAFNHTSRTALLLDLVVPLYFFAGFCPASSSVKQQSVKTALQRFRFQDSKQVAHFELNTWGNDFPTACRTCIQSMCGQQLTFFQSLDLFMNDAVICCADDHSACTSCRGPQGTSQLVQDHGSTTSEAQLPQVCSSSRSSTSCHILYSPTRRKNHKAPPYTAAGAGKQHKKGLQIRSSLRLTCMELRHGASRQLPWRAACHRMHAQCGWCEMGEYCFMACASEPVH